MGSEYSGDNNRMIEDMGAFQFSDVEGALKELYEWHEQNRQIIVKEQL